MDLALKALSLDVSNADAIALLGLVYFNMERYDLAINKLNRAIELNSNDVSSLRIRGLVMLWSGSVDEAFRNLKTAYRFDPNMLPGGFTDLGIGYYLMFTFQATEGIVNSTRC